MKLPNWAFYCLAAILICVISISVSVTVHTMLYNYAVEDLKTEMKNQLQQKSQNPQF